LGFLEGLTVTAGILAILIVGGLLTGCSASSRLENIVPSSANSPPAMPQYQGRKEDRNKPDTPQVSKSDIKPQERPTTAPQATIEE
jgi:hypothetical protein